MFRKLSDTAWPAVLAVTVVLLAGACTAQAPSTAAPAPPRPSIRLDNALSTTSNDCSDPGCVLAPTEPLPIHMATCPSTVAVPNGLSEPAQMRTGVLRVMVPGRPSTGWVCRYHDDQSGALQVQAAPIPLEDHQAGNLTDLLNAGAVIPAGVAYSCGAALSGSEVKYLIFLIYDTGPNLEVAVDSWDCRWSYNGLIKASTTAKLWAVLEALGS